ncbi:LCP family protein [Dialister sp.]|uniref:LCP family protein n=1 Tax=Dialister sp. TaxID=1955814 RepID=UPI002E821201|nr:LCP family protein [Dialister sp.]MEE3452017.1 LCP family protein [Dialister sp.]
MRKNKHRKTRIRVKKLIFCIITLLIILGVLILGIGKGVSFILAKIHDTDQPLCYYLIIGTDETSGNEADSILLSAWNAKDREITFLSIPPNTKLSRQEKTNQLIKSTYTEGGAEETRSAVENLLHIRINKYAVLNYADFQRYIDKAGGLNLYVEKDMSHRDKNGEEDIAIRKGYQELDGTGTLGYVRFLDEKAGEIDRIQRQERILKKLVETMHDRFAIYNWIAARLIWSASETDITPSEAASMAYAVTGYPPENFKYVILPGEIQKINKVNTWVVNPVEVQKAIALTIGSGNNSN